MGEVDQRYNDVINLAANLTTAVEDLKTAMTKNTPSSAPPPAPGTAPATPQAPDSVSQVETAIHDVTSSPVVQDAEQIIQDVIVPVTGQQALDDIKQATIVGAATGNTQQLQNTVAQVGELLEEHHATILDELKAHTDVVSKMVDDALSLLGTSNDAKQWRRKIFGVILGAALLFLAAVFIASASGDQWAKNNIQLAVEAVGFVMAVLSRSGVD